MAKPVTGKRKPKRVTDRMIATKFRHYFSIKGCAGEGGEMTTDEVTKLLEVSQAAHKGDTWKTGNAFIHAFTPAVCAELCRELLDAKRKIMELGQQVMTELRREAAQSQPPIIIYQERRKP